MAITTCCLEKFGTTWSERYGELEGFKVRFGNCLVPRNWPENHQLANWVGNQRAFFRRNKLAVEQIQKLNAIDFEWEPIDQFWEEMFAALVRYKQLHHDCNVPQEFPDNQELANWLGNQRHRKERLTAEQVLRLDEQGVIWNPREALWETNFASLVRFKEKHGHCDVTRSNKEFPGLAQWVNNQRALKRNNKLSGDRIRRLDVQGFKWNARNDLWEEMFGALADYKRLHGHCDVPAIWPKNPQLGRWVHIQRQFRKRNTLSAERIKQLNATGFRWETKLNRPHPSETTRS